jgi:hypothetical protein
MIRFAIALKSNPPKKEEKSARGIIASYPEKRNKENMYSIHASRHTALKIDEELLLFFKQMQG